MLKENTNAITKSINSDFGHRSRHETQLLEIMPAIRSARHARSHVGKWMRPERRPVSLWFRFGRARIVRQPLGVVGILAPWNYPLLLSFGPLVAALAAGNRVMVKMSEFSTAFGSLLAELVARHFAQDHVTIVQGGVEVGKAFAALPFDHLLYTGGTSVGREVMKAAAANLTPVTLELGGKSPAIVAPDFPLEAAAARILWGKCLNAGQSCIAPDYVLVPAGKEQAFADAARAEVKKCYPAGAASDDYSSIIHARHYERLQSCLADAVAKGAIAVPLMGGLSIQTRKLPPTVLLNVTDDMLVMQDEIFGPLLPVVGYATIDDAIRFVADRPRPLALYYFDHNRQRIQRVLQTTISGGVTVNDTMLHIAQEDLPFGGVGPSGMGHYHGEDGFLTFSKRKGVFLQSRCNAVHLLNPPYGAQTERVSRWMG
jgi:acyl-CoA reductase-like NAD-dependent aldehyde dehydrogenase